MGTWDPQSGTGILWGQGPPPSPLGQGTPPLGIRTPTLGMWGSSLGDTDPPGHRDPQFGDMEILGGRDPSMGTETPPPPPLEIGTPPTSP